MTATLLLSPTVTIERQPGEERITGMTSGRQEAVGRRLTWRVKLPMTELPLWDTQWSTGEREIVLARPEYVPPLPAPVINLMGRRRASVARRADRTWVMTVKLVLPDSDGWPRFRKCTADELNDECGAALISRLKQIGLVTLGEKSEVLGATGRNKGELCAVTNDEVGPSTVATYVVTRVVPTLRRVGVI